MNGPHRATYRVTALRRTDDLRSLLGWRYEVDVFAYDDSVRRMAPAPFTLADTLFCWRGRARSPQKADDLGEYLVALCLRRDAQSARPKWWNRPPPTDQ